MTKIFEEQRSPSAELMGSEFVSFDPETSELTTRFTAPASFASPRGAVQGGLIAGFLDEVMGGALLAASDHAGGGMVLPLNLDMNLTFVAMVPIAPIIAKGRVVRAGRRVVFLEGELFDEEGKLLARARSTALPTEVPE
ncbi:MAG: PaaI family thioesterase [Erythrobacter sp.]